MISLGLPDLFQTANEEDSEFSFLFCYILMSIRLDDITRALTENSQKF